MMEARLLGDTGVALVTSGKGIVYGVDLENPDHVQVRSGAHRQPQAGFWLPAGHPPARQPAYLRADMARCQKTQHTSCAACQATGFPKAFLPLHSVRSRCHSTGPLPPCPLLQPVHYVGTRTNHCLAAPFANGTRTMVAVFGMDLIQLLDTSNPWKYTVLQVGTVFLQCDVLHAHHMLCHVTHQAP